MADPEVRFPETYVSGVPVWAKRRKRSGLHPIVSTLVLLLALFGAVMIGVSLRMGSVEKGGAVVDGWIAFAHKQTTAAVGDLSGESAKVEAPATVDEPVSGKSAPEEGGEAVPTPDTAKETKLSQSGRKGGRSEVETQETLDEPMVGQSGRKGGRYAAPTQSSPVAESEAAR